MDVNGTLVWYYHICKREVWLMHRQIIPDQKDMNIDIGRFIHEHSYKRNSKEIYFGNVKFDIFEKTRDGIVIGEIKKSSKAEEASRMQLLYYLYQLKEAGIKASGVLRYPEERKNTHVKLNRETEKHLLECIEDIKRIALSNIAPEVFRKPVCRRCGYREYCYA